MLYAPSQATAMFSLSGTETVGSGTIDGYRGIAIKTGAKRIMVTHLGRYNISTNKHKHQLVILKGSHTGSDESNGVLDASNVPSEVVASAIIDPTGTPDNNYNYVQLEQPVVLEPNTNYVIASYESYNSSTQLGDTYLAGQTRTVTLGMGAGTLWSPSNGNLTTVNTTSGTASTGNNIQIQIYTMNPQSDGQWTTVSNQYGPVVNVKIQ